MKYALLLTLILWAIIILAVSGAMALQPCPVEDSNNCYWDATTMGNGEGRSFININGEYFYVN